MKSLRLYSIFGGSWQMHELTPEERTHLKLWAMGVIPGPKPEPLSEEQVATALAYLTACTTPLKSTRKGVVSYGVKHRIESWGRDNGLSPYVSNRAAIEAVRRLGWPIAIADDRNYPNAVLGLREKGQR